MNEIIVFKIAFGICIAVLIICIRAYLDARKNLRWYKKQFKETPRAKAYHRIEKNTIPQSIMNWLLTIK